MKKLGASRGVIFGACAFLLLYALAFVLVPQSLACVASALITLLAALLFGRTLKRRTKPSPNTRQVLLLLAVMGALYVTLYYLSGLSFGFYRARAPLSFESLLRCVIPTVVSVVACELLRATLLAQRSALSSVLGFLMCFSSEVLLAATVAEVTSFNSFMDVVGIVAFPALSGGLLYGYLSSRHGLLPALVYRLILSLYAYFIPFASGIPDSLLAFARLVIPLLILVFIRKLYERKSEKAIKRLGKWAIAGIASSLLLMCVSVMLVSGEFRYGILVIATESMTGEYNKGDGVFYEEYSDQPIAEGDVLVFQKGGQVIVHRVTDARRVNGETRFTTKGDANEDEDLGYVTEKEIIGVTKAKIPYFGYLTLWARELFSK
ncbi:MAG: signal peptidase I [Clostridia bacterium]|nr:signal peptidase I [Clostridia bacterium]